ncbi:MAG: CgeB family protein [Vicinamibacterales bacterium]
MSAPVLLVANPDPIHVGGHLLGAARKLRVDLQIADSRDAFRAPAWKRRVNWWLNGHRPAALREFSDRVVSVVRTGGVRCLLSTGIAPIDANSLRVIGSLGVRRLNFLTDDPWNAEHRAPWFLRAIGEYDHVFSPRRANLDELLALGGPEVSHLPFAYSPDVHYPELPVTPEECRRFSADLAFVGGADRDRVTALSPFVAAGFDVALYGGYWDRYAATRSHARGFVNHKEVRKAIGGAKVSICLVRRANRDGHSMRSFEVAAMGGCMLVEDTAEHRDMFGLDGDAVVYFRTPAEGVDLVRTLLGDASRRATLSTRVRALIGSENHTYAARLLRMVASAEQAVA